MLIHKVNEDTFIESLIELEIPYDLVQSIQKAILMCNYQTIPEMVGTNEAQLILGAIEKRVAGIDTTNKWRIIIEKI